MCEEKLSKICKTAMVNSSSFMPSCNATLQLAPHFGASCKFSSQYTLFLCVKIVHLFLWCSCLFAYNFVFVVFWVFFCTTADLMIMNALLEDCVSQSYILDVVKRTVSILLGNSRKPLWQSVLHVASSCFVPALQTWHDCFLPHLFVNIDFSCHANISQYVVFMY